jgi:hypothetical protein
VAIGDPIADGRKAGLGGISGITDMVATGIIDHIGGE